MVFLATSGGSCAPAFTVIMCNNLTCTCYIISPPISLRAELLHIYSELHIIYKPTASIGTAVRKIAHGCVYGTVRIADEAIKIN